MQAVQISGNIAYSPVVTNEINSHKIISRLVPTTFCEYWVWGSYRFYNYYGLSMYKDETINMLDMDLPILKDTALQTIKGDSNNILIILK